jgi:hypothetical protein
VRLQGTTLKQPKEHASPVVLKKDISHRCMAGKKLTVRDRNVASVGSCEKLRAQVEPKTVGAMESKFDHYTIVFFTANRRRDDL